MRVARTVRHRGLGFALDLPAGLEAEQDVGNIALIARAEEPDVPDGFHANLVVAAQRIGAGDASDPQQRTDSALEAHERELRDMHLLDRAKAWVADVPAVRTLAHHNFGGRAITLEQWRFVRDGLGWELSASCPTLDYPTNGARLAMAAESIRFS
jgi:hypothetical protein